MASPVKGSMAQAEPKPAQPNAQLQALIDQGVLPKPSGAYPLESPAYLLEAIRALRASGKPVPGQLDALEFQLDPPKALSPNRDRPDQLDLTAYAETHPQLKPFMEAAGLWSVKPDFGGGKRPPVTEQSTMEGVASNVPGAPGLSDADLNDFLQLRNEPLDNSTARAMAARMTPAQRAAYDAGAKLPIGSPEQRAAWRKMFSPTAPQNDPSYQGPSGSQEIAPVPKDRLFAEAAKAAEDYDNAVAAWREAQTPEALQAAKDAAQNMIDVGDRNGVMGLIGPRYRDGKLYAAGAHGDVRGEVADWQPGPLTERATTPEATAIRKAIERTKGPTSGAIFTKPDLPEDQTTRPVSPETQAALEPELKTQVFNDQPRTGFDSERPARFDADSSVGARSDVSLGEPIEPGRPPLPVGDIGSGAERGMLPRAAAASTGGGMLGKVGSVLGDAAGPLAMLAGAAGGAALDYYGPNHEAARAFVDALQNAPAEQKTAGMAAAAPAPEPEPINPEAAAARKAITRSQAPLTPGRTAEDEANLDKSLAEGMAASRAEGVEPVSPEAGAARKALNTVAPAIISNVQIRKLWSTLSPEERDAAVREAKASRDSFHSYNLDNTP